MKSIILDSSIFISSAESGDIFHHQTKDFVARLNETIPDVKILVPAIIFLEVANILRKTKYNISSIFSQGEFAEYTRELAEKMIPIFPKINLKSSDASIVACAKVFEADLVSWDKKLLREAKRLVKASSPDEYFD